MPRRKSKAQEPKAPRGGSGGGKGPLKRLGGLISGLVSGLFRLIRKVLIAAVILAVLGLVAASITHWYKGLDLVSSMKADVEDARVFVNCPLKLQNVGKFVARSEAQETYLKALQTSKLDWVSQACTGDIWTLLGKS